MFPHYLKMYDTAIRWYGSKTIYPDFTLVLWRGENLFIYMKDIIASSVTWYITKSHTHTHTHTHKQTYTYVIQTADGGYIDLTTDATPEEITVYRAQTLANDTG